MTLYECVYAEEPQCKISEDSASHLETPVSYPRVHQQRSARRVGPHPAAAGRKRGGTGCLSSST